jgi:hypothetical protein
MAGGNSMSGSEKEKSKNKRASEESESNSEDFARGKRTSKKRRRLELRGSLKDVRRKKNKHRNFGSDGLSDSSDSSSDHEGKNDSNSGDDASRDNIAGSSSSD